jgi:sulfur oxygenase/reductase
MPQLLGVTDVPAVMAQSFIQQKAVPKVRLPFQRVIAVGEHKIKEGCDQQFEGGAEKTLRELKENASGMIGWAILKKIGDSGLGPMQFTPPYLWEALETLGANPPSRLLTNYGEWGKDYYGVAVPHRGHPEYLVHMEWENPDMLNFGLALTAVNPRIRQTHDEGVMVHLAQVPPYYRVFVPLMEDMVFFH